MVVTKHGQSYLSLMALGSPDTLQTVRPVTLDMPLFRLISGLFFFKFSLSIIILSRLIATGESFTESNILLLTICALTVFAFFYLYSNRYVSRRRPVDSAERFRLQPITSFLFYGAFITCIIVALFTHVAVFLLMAGHL